jgi:toxin secretion/phage lysis holin
LGGWDVGIQAFIFMVVVDYGTGLLKATINKNLSSYIGLRGIAKKVCLFILIAVSVQLEMLVNQPNTLHNLVSYALVVNEAVSILENISEMGVPIPPILIKFLKKMKDKDNKKDGDKK